MMTGFKMKKISDRSQRQTVPEKHVNARISEIKSGQIRVSGKEIVLLVLIFAFSLILLSCASSSSRVPNDTVEDVLISFKYKIQEGDFKGATDLITEDEQTMLLGPDGDVKSDFKKGMVAMNLSTLQKHKFQLDGDNRLIGMYEVIQVAARKTMISEEQRTLDLKAIESKYAKPDSANVPSENGESEDSGEGDSENSIEDSPADDMEESVEDDVESTDSASDLDSDAEMEEEF